ncbi:caspase family protein [Microcoleus sp. FACHB-1515]|uniref:nSTAND1 domain-containing NTPase n=1 Tax=Cyanophyceae TaxID=3028117 RepID=UPI001688F2B1|nr:caspase family protein [Microcoleus sp. FACHB-1515]MBD2089070.1 caspase family protein [Microcoleus sp. FACHB-1515]
MVRDALIVGVNTYQHLPALQAPARDAEAIAQQIQSCGDFRVHRLPEVIQAGQPQVGLKTPVTLKELEAALVRLFKPKGSNVPQTALFYFSGHGIQKEAGIEEGYLATSDVNPEAGFYGLSLFWLRRLLQESPVRQRVIILDCCHSGELLNFLEADPGARAGTDRLFMAASREYESAYESLASPYSVFTQALLNGLNPQHSETGIVTNYSITAWVSQALKGEIQQPLFESSGSEIILTRSSAASPPQRSPTAASEVCPYRGLAYFDEVDAEYFFGREEISDQLIAKLRGSKFAAIVGASGSGKSSLLRAGLVHQLRQGHRSLESAHWQIKLITPGEHPLKSLAAPFVDLNAAALERAEQLRRAEAFLQTGSSGLAQLIQASLLDQPRNLAAPPHLLLVIDQFEEALTLCHSEFERQQFFDSLATAIATVERLSIVIGLRSDFVVKCSQYASIAPLLANHAVAIAPLNYEQIKSAITRPAQKVGLVCDPNLVYTMLLDVMGAPGELPLLQYTLQQLWQQRQIDGKGVAHLTLDTYTTLGGIRGTLQQRATEVFNGLAPAEQAIAQRIFLALTQLGEGTEDTRRRVIKSELVRPDCSIEQIDRTLEKLVAAKLVITSQGDESADHAEAIDVTHEALIRSWPLLRTWLENNREMLRRQRRIEQAAQEWQQVGRAIAPEYLLHGARLTEAEDFVRTHVQELSALAQEYVYTSQQERERVRRASRRLQFALPAVVALALLAVVEVALQPREDETETALPLSALITQTIKLPSESNGAGGIAIERLVIDSEPQQAQAGLHCALAQLNPQVASSERRVVPAQSEAAIVPNQQYIATASSDGTLHLQAIEPSLTNLPNLDPDCIE